MSNVILPAQGIAPDKSAVVCMKSDNDDAPLGVLARRLEARARHTLRFVRRYKRRIGIPVLDLARILFYAPRLAHRVQAENGVSALAQIAAQFRLAYSHGVDPSLYYFVELYKPGALDRIDQYFTRREVKGALLRQMHRLRPAAAEHRINLGDKLEFSGWCASRGLEHAAPLMLIEGGHVVWQKSELSDLDRDLFVKPRVSRGARGATYYRRIAPLRYESQDGRRMSLGEIADDLIKRFGKTNLMILPRLQNHHELADMATDSLITVRAVTCLDEQDQPELVVAYLRILTKLEHRWDVKWPVTEYASAVDLRSGRLSEMTGDQPECLSQRYDRHPVTGAWVTGRVLPCWDQVVSLAHQAHRVATDRVMVGWDIAITPDGAMLLEGNSYPDVHYPQRIYKRPYGEMRIGQLLRHHMLRLERKLSQESKNQAGA